MFRYICHNFNDQNIFLRALAKNCKAPLDSKVGGDSGDNWKQGKPCRVVRNCKGRKHSEYAPEEGNRYDGIYKVSTRQVV